MFMRFLLLLSSFYLMLLANSSSSSSMQQPLCHDSESSALIQFKQSFLINESASGDPSAYPKVATWKSHKEGEGEGSDCCSWDGVECDRETGHVIGLHLASSCLYGSINSSSNLFSLVYLKKLDLSDNHFNYSEIPSAVGQLSWLRSLDLFYSHFSGQIPSGVLPLSKLVFLDLSANPMLRLQKPGLRDLVQNLTHLKTLQLSQVNISSPIPHALAANLFSLTSLFLGECGLHGEFPRNIFQLPSLQYLSVWYNLDLIGYLLEFEEASPLKMLDLGGTSFSGQLPTSIGRLGSLTDLDISSCNFTGKIPPSLANLTALNSLSLSENNFSAGTLSWLSQQTKLTTLLLDQINLKGEIPASLVNMSQLTILSLEENQLGGQIPSWLMNLTRLTVLQLAKNEFEGSIPSSLFELVNLENLDLALNYLNGTVELHAFSKLKNLTQLQLSGNRLSLLSYNSTNASFPKFTLLGLGGCNLREFPDFLQKQDELEVLFLDGNKIRGPIPKWVWNMSTETLGALLLSQNHLTGFDQLPAILPWSRLQILDLSSNMLQGSLPVPPPSTYKYSVSENEFTGEIPELICNLTSLKWLALSSNNFNGRIPQCLTSLSSSLSILDLKHNNLHGTIPPLCSNPSSLRMIDLSGNKLQGQIPRSLANCTMLDQLVLGNNMINDTFPSWLGSLPMLQVLILRSNLLHGAVGRPRADFEFSKLRIIDLSDNGFTGDLPSEYFRIWDAMDVVFVDHLTYMQADTVFHDPRYTWSAHYEFSMTMSSKGTTRKYGKIPDFLIVIDLSSNKFHGEIPESIGDLKGLQGLNLSNNAVTGPIPTSLANLTQLEALDLSQNKLSGEIPQQLVELTFLAFFNVSHNNLRGLIPQGKQFGTFSNISFDGNPGLCGSPLSRTCGNSEPPSPAPSTLEQGSSSEFDWRLVLMGYGSGLVIGVSSGYILTIWKHEWFVRTFEKPRIERMGLRS